MTGLATTRTESQVLEILAMLVACDGRVRIAVQRLGERDIDISQGELTLLKREKQALIATLAAEVGAAKEEAIVQEMRDLVRLSQSATRVFLEDLNERLEQPGGLDYETRRQMPQIMQAVSKITQTSADKILAFTGRPTGGPAGDPLAATKKLIELGVLTPVDRPQVDAESTATEGTP